MTLQTHILLRSLACWMCFPLVRPLFTFFFIFSSQSLDSAQSILFCCLKLYTFWWWCLVAFIRKQHISAISVEVESSIWGVEYRKTTFSHKKKAKSATIKQILNVIKQKPALIWTSVFMRKLCSLENKHKAILDETVCRGPWILSTFEIKNKTNSFPSLLECNNYMLLLFCCNICFVLDICCCCVLSFGPQLIITTSLSCCGASG